MKFCYIIILCFIIFLQTVSAGSTRKNLHDEIVESYENGDITKTEQIYYQLAAIYNPALLSEHFKGNNPTYSRDATRLKFQAYQQYQISSMEEKELLLPFLSRPAFANLTETFISESGLFKIHYTTSGDDAATLDFIKNTAAAFDYSYDYEINTLGYMPPPIDDPDDPQYDVYIYNFGDYGATTPENNVPGTKRDDYTSFIEMDNDFVHTPTKGVGAINVTAAHEFFHMIHLGYRGYQNTDVDPIFLFESTATWMEDMVFDDVNDYYYYIPSLFNNLDKQFYSTGYSHEYGLAVFHHMLEKKYGPDVIRDIWEHFTEQEVFDAIEQALHKNGSSLKNELADFSIWNYFTGDRANATLYYPEGEFYPQISYTQESQIGTTISITDKVEQQSTNYYKVSVKSSGDYVIEPEFTEPENWIYSVILHSMDDQLSVLQNGGDTPENLENVRSLTDIIICPIYARVPDVNFTNNRSKEFSLSINRGRVDEGENEIVSVKPNPFMPDVHGKTNILFNLADQRDNVYVRLFTETGLEINRVFVGLCPDGLNVFQWDGTSASGEGVVSGVYLVIIEGDQLIGPEKIALIR